MLFSDQILFFIKPNGGRLFRTAFYSAHLYSSLMCASPSAFFRTVQSETEPYFMAGSGTAVLSMENLVLLMVLAVQKLK